MRRLRSRSLCVWLVLVGGSAAIVAYHVGRPGGGTDRQSVAEPDGRWRLGLVTADPVARSVSFPGRVARASGEVAFLIHLQGYQWLEAESAIVSPARLADLQAALATLDWRLWDALWTGQQLEDDRPTSRLHVTLSWDGSEVDAGELVQSERPAEAQDLIFFGTPHFDDVVLGAEAGRACVSCPLLPLEKEHLERLFRERQRRPRYQLKGGLPPPGEEVLVRIDVRDD